MVTWRNFTKSTCFQCIFFVSFQTLLRNYIFTRYECCLFIRLNLCLMWAKLKDRNSVSFFNVSPNVIYSVGSDNILRWEMCSPVWNNVCQHFDLNKHIRKMNGQTYTFTRWTTLSNGRMKCCELLQTQLH